MQSKTVSRRVPLSVVLAILILFVAILLYFIPKSFIQGKSSPIGETAIASLKQEQVFSVQEQVTADLPDLPDLPTARPARLKIPSINVDAPVEYVGIASDGAMDAPKERANTAWFNLGPRPGENGSAVIAGHYGWKNRKASVFDNLHKLRKGDKIYIENDDGEVISFVVRESRRYDPKADASDVFGSSDGESHLNLVTCEGIWDKASASYSKRLVVFADKETE